MTIPSADQLASYIVGILGLCGAVYERLKSAKRTEKTEIESSLLTDARMFQDRATMLEGLAVDNLKLYTDEREEHKRTREYWHEKASEFQAALSKSQLIIEDYKSRPDLTAIMKHIESQATTSIAILNGIRDIMEQLKSLLKMKEI